MVSSLFPLLLYSCFTPIPSRGWSLKFSATERNLYVMFRTNLVEMLEQHLCTQNTPREKDKWGSQQLWTFTGFQLMFPLKQPDCLWMVWPDPFFQPGLSLLNIYKYHVRRYAGQCHAFQISWIPRLCLSLQYLFALCLQRGLKYRFTECILARHLIP